MLIDVDKLPTVGIACEPGVEASVACFLDQTPPCPSDRRHCVGLHLHVATGAGQTPEWTAASLAQWTPGTWTPFDPAARLLAVEGPVREREAVRAFELWRTAPRGYDNGARRARLRAHAERALADVAANHSPRRASHAGTPAPAGD